MADANKNNPTGSAQRDSKMNDLLMMFSTFAKLTLLFGFNAITLAPIWPFARPVVEVSKIFP